MDTLKNFNRYWTVTFNYEYYENGLQVPPGPGVPTTTSQNYPYWAQPSYPQDPANFIDPWEPRSDIIKTPLAPVSWNATYTIKYYYISENVIAFYSSSPMEPIFDSTLPYVVWDPNWYLIFKNFNWNQICIEDTDYTVPSLSYINRKYNTNFEPGVMTQELKAILGNEWWLNLYMPWVSLEPAWILGEKYFNDNVLNYCTPWQWDQNLPLLTSNDLNIIRSWFTNINFWYLKWSSTAFDQTPWWTWIFTSLFSYTGGGRANIQGSKAQEFSTWVHAPIMSQFETSQRWWISISCIEPYSNWTSINVINLDYNLSFDPNTWYYYGLTELWFIRLKDPNRCIYAS